MTPHRLRAPSADGGLLAEPPLAEASTWLEANRQHLDAWDHDFQGRRAGRLRTLARREILNESRRFARQLGLEPVEIAPGAPDPLARPWILTGHQPELFHPGVWVKNFATARLAQTLGGVGVNLIVDNDIPKSASIRVPYLEAGELKARRVEFDAWDAEVPFEDWSVSDEGTFETFSARTLELLGGLVPDPLIRDDWPRALNARARTNRVGLRLTRMRCEREALWGAGNVEIPLSMVCQSEAFLWFVAHLLAQFERFQHVHNAALERYRGFYGIRSRHHPVPALGTEDDWREAPFWVWRVNEPRRRPLLVRQRSRTMEIRIAGEAEPLLELPLAPDREACCAVDRLRELPAMGVRLRTRALTTTMFARLLVGDLFLHGIGGAKYDELGDEITRGFFGIEPPPFMTLSMTLWMGLPDEPTTPEQLRAVEHQVRELTFNPDRHLQRSHPKDDTHRSQLIETKRRAIALPTETRRQRSARFFAIREANAALQPDVAAERARLTAERDRLAAGLARNQLAHHREFAAVLHSCNRLREKLNTTLTVDRSA